MENRLRNPGKPTFRPSLSAWTTLIASVLLIQGLLTAGEVYRPGKGWTPAEPGDQAKADLTTAPGMLQHAQTLWQNGKLKDCRDLCRTIIERHRTGPAVEQAYVLLVRTQAALRDLNDAQRNVDRFRKSFPDSPFTSLMADAEMDILERYAVRGDEKVLKRLRKSVDDNPYGPRADRAQLLIGHVHLHHKRYDDARDAYDLVIRLYPRTPHRLEAEFGKGKATYLANQGVMRDAGYFIEADQIITGVLKTDPNFIHRDEAERYLREIHNCLAERQFRVARYYEGQRRSNAAALYYRDVIRRFDNTPWSAKARKRLKALNLPTTLPEAGTATKATSKETSGD